MKSLQVSDPENWPVVLFILGLIVYGFLAVLWMEWTEEGADKKCIQETGFTCPRGGGSNEPDPWDNLPNW